MSVGDVLNFLFIIVVGVPLALLMLAVIVFVGFAIFSDAIKYSKHESFSGNGVSCVKWYELAKCDRWDGSRYNQALCKDLARCSKAEFTLQGTHALE